MQPLYSDCYRKGSVEAGNRYAGDPELKRAYAGLVRASRRAQVTTKGFARAVNAAARAAAEPQAGAVCSLCGGPLQPYATGDPDAPMCWGCIDRLIAEDKARRIADGSPESEVAA